MVPGLQRKVHSGLQLRNKLQFLYGVRWRFGTVNSISYNDNNNNAYGLTYPLPELKVKEKERL